jgi:ABC-2 type transport system ATP-binding protein
MAVTPAVELSGIRKTYRIREALRRTRAFHAVDGVDLRIEPGEVLGLLGLNGAGKTTLIKVMAGLLIPDGGTGRVLGYDIYRDHRKIRASVSLVAPTADVGTDNNLTVRQNLEFWAVVYNVEPKFRAERIDELLQFLDLKEYESFWPMSISAGMRQRLAIARSLLVRNPILFLDEPTVKLDAPGAQAVRDFVRRINREFGVTIVLTTHLIFEAEELCDRVAIMDQGKILSCDSVHRLRKNLQRYDSFTIGCSDVPESLVSGLSSSEEVVRCDYRDSALTISAENLESVLFSTLRLLREQGVEISSVATDEPTLEDIFMTAVRK